MTGHFKSPGQRRTIVDYGRLEDIPRTKGLFRQYLKLQWKFYSELAFQRAQIYDDLKGALREKATPQFEFIRWQRAVKFKYALNPLSACGSVKDPAGGRFNIGEIDPTRFSPFPALYIASDKDTAESELLARNARGELLTSEDLALVRSASIAIVSLSGKLDSVLDLQREGALDSFVDLVRGFKFSAELRKEAKQVDLFQIPDIIGTVSDMEKSLLRPDWRLSPTQWDIPANSQIIGQIVKDAGIEGIVYPSVLTQQPCLAIFPQNFADSSSYVELDDPVPSELAKKRLDETNFRDFI